MNNLITSFRDDSVLKLPNDKSTKIRSLLNNTALKTLLYNGEVSKTKIKKSFVLLKRKYYKIVVEGIETFLTNALFLKDNNELVNITQLKNGDSILTENGFKKVQNITEIEFQDYSTFIDIDIENDDFIIVNNLAVKIIESSMFSAKIST